MNAEARAVTTPMAGAGQLIREAVTSWPGVEAAPTASAAVEYRYGRKEMGPSTATASPTPLPRRLHDQVILEGRAQLTASSTPGQDVTGFPDQLTGACMGVVTARASAFIRTRSGTVFDEMTG